MSIEMGRKSITGGVIQAGPHRIQFDSRIESQRFRPTLPWIPTEANLKRARAVLARIKAQIIAGTFCFEAEFPRYKGPSRLPPPFRARTCGEVFDAFLRHEEVRLARGDLAAVTVTSHRGILDRLWRPPLGALPLLGVTYLLLVQIADYDAAHGVLSITKARVNGIDQDVTKTGEYPKPYVARHTSVSWNLMAGRNPLLVAKEHGHRLTTMLTVYTAWVDGAVEADIMAIRDAMNRSERRQSAPVPR